jgi:hypothetical protein
MLFCSLAAHHLFADSVDDYVREQMKVRHIPGLVLVVLKDGMVYHIGAGMVEYAHVLDPDLTVILFTNNQGFNPYRLTINVMQFFVPEIGKRHN